jgi:hypothetical protein
VIAVAACAGESTPAAEPPSPAPPIDAAVRPDAAVAARPCNDTLESVEAGLAANHPCKAWLEKTFARVVMLPPYGSGVVWSLDTERKTGLLLSAAHVFQFANGMRFGPKQRYGFFEPEAYGHRFIACTPSASGMQNPTGPVVSILYWPGSKDVVKHGWMTILPADDFMLATLAGDVAAADCATATNGQADLQLHSMQRDQIAPKLDLATAAVPIAPIAGHAQVIAIGFPEDRTQSYTVARVLDDDEAKRRIIDLAKAGDEEGAIPYAKDVELLADGVVRSGTSGGGVFDRDGKLVGIIVRGNRRGPATLRAVRATYILEQLRAGWKKSPKPKLAGYLERAITQ